MGRVCGWSSSPTATAISAVKMCHLHLATSPGNQTSSGQFVLASNLPQSFLLCNTLIHFKSKKTTISFLPSLLVKKTGIPTRKKHPPLLFCSLQHDDICDAPGRRDALLQLTSSALVHLSAPTFSSPALALALTDAPPQFRLYSDDINKYQISIPQDWQVGAGKTDGVRSITAFYPQLDSASNVSVLITGIGPDFTRMESFGKVDAFAETLVSGLDRSWQRPPGVAAKLLDCKAAKGLYYIEYTLQSPGESRRHIYSAIGMANNGWYNRLYTVTGQYVDEEADKYSSMIEKAVKSFRFS